jgi:hypothetical protein
MTDNVADEKPLPDLKVKIVDEEHESFRDRLIAILELEDLAHMTITLRGGKEIDIGSDKRNPLGFPVRVRVGRDYVEVNIAPGAGAVPIYEMVRFSEIASVRYF